MMMTRKAVALLLGVGIVVFLVEGAKIPQEIFPAVDSKASGPLGHPFHWGANMTTPQLIRALGYPVEIHHVTTEDGYILELHRIPYGIAGPSDQKRPVALLEHCLLGSSAAYVMNTPKEALAYILADAGYDVWLPNLRGSTYSRNHTDLDPDQYEFWNFSWDEMALYDVPFSIDYALEVSGADSLHYVGWSMGTTVFWAMMSERPEYNQKVRSMAALAPVAYLSHVKGLGKVLGDFNKLIEESMAILKIGEILPQSKLMNFLVESLCDKENPLSPLCYAFLAAVAGPDKEEFNKDHLPVILTHFPSGTSVKAVTHYGQMMKSGQFSKYDFGKKGNLQRYGQETPPTYDLSRTTVPVGLFWGNTDYLANPTDVAQLAEELPYVVLNYEVPREQFNHMDFSWAIHTRKYVYSQLLEFIQN